MINPPQRHVQDAMSILQTTESPSLLKEGVEYVTNPFEYIYLLVHII